VNDQSAWPLIVVIALVLLLAFSGGGVLPIPIDPPPITEPGFRVLVIEETAERGKLPKDQLTILTSTEVRAYLNAKCVKGPDGKTPEYRFFDKDTDLSHESEVWQKAMAAAKGTQGFVVPWLIVSDGKKGEDGPLPANVADMMTELKKYGGP
jgi:hypothetical protein